MEKMCFQKSFLFSEDTYFTYVNTLFSQYDILKTFSWQIELKRGKLINVPAASVSF